MWRRRPGWQAPPGPQRQSRKAEGLQPEAPGCPQAGAAAAACFPVIGRSRPAGHSGRCHSVHTAALGLHLLQRGRKSDLGPGPGGEAVAGKSRAGEGRGAQSQGARAGRGASFSPESPEDVVERLPDPTEAWITGLDRNPRF